MKDIRTALGVVLTVLCLARGTAAQKDEPQPCPPSCTFVGASVSHGMPWRDYEIFCPESDPLTFAEKQLKRTITEREYEWRTDSIGISKAIRSVAADDGPKVYDRSDIFALRRTKSNIRRQLKFATRKSRLVIGVDLLIWFGYGRTPAVPRRVEAERAAAITAKARFKLQQIGFDLIDEYLAGNDTVLIVGDYPDLTEANELILPAHSKPTPSTLLELNERLDAFVAKRDRVHVYRLSKTLRDARTGKLRVLSNGAERVFHDHLALQLDEMHPNQFGAIFLAHDIARFVRQHAPEVSSCLPEATSFDAMLRALDLETEQLDKLHRAVGKSVPNDR